MFPVNGHSLDREIEETDIVEVGWPGRPRIMRVALILRLHPKKQKSGEYVHDSVLI